MSNMTEPQTSKGNGDDVTTLKLILHNTSDDSQLEHGFTCQNNLNTVTVSKVKKHVEIMYDIPVTFQELYFESVVLRDEQTLGTIREGDTIVVKYSGVADVKVVTETVRLLKQCLEAVKQHSGPASSLVELKADADKVGEIAVRYFGYESERGVANSLLFVQRGGVKTLVKLYDLVLKVDSINTTQWIEVMIADLLRTAVLYRCSRIPSLRKQVLESSILDCVIRSFTRHSLQELLSAPIKDELQLACLDTSEVNILFLARIEEFQLQIASNEKVLQQILRIAVNDDYSIGLMAVMTLDSLSKNIDTHVYLTSPKVINSVFTVERLGERDYFDLEFYHLPVLKSFIATFFSELVCHSAEIIPLLLKTEIYQFMKALLKMSDHKELRQCSDIVPLNTLVDLVSAVSLPYSPLDPTNCHYTPAHNHIMKKLKQLCVEFGVLRLHCEVLDEHKRNFIVENGLLDYVVCLPWMMAPGSGAQKRARDLVAFLSEVMLLQPPSLINLARAKLAQMHLGLKKAAKLSVLDICECIK